MAPLTTSTTSRLLLLLSLLQTRRDWPGQVLAERLDISHRTVRRDIDRLRDMGYAITAMKGPGAGYRLEAGAELPPLLLDDDQVIALAVALQSHAVTGAGLEEAALRALTTIRQMMPSRLRYRLDAITFTAVSPPSGATGSVPPDVLGDLSAAVRAREVLRFDYATTHPPAGDAVSRRRVEPHHVVTSRGRWYLLAWDLDRDDWRIFRADRIAPRVPTGPRFAAREVPGGSVHDYVLARFKGADQDDVWPCRGTVVLGLPADAVLPFAGDGTVVDLGPDRCSLEVGSWSWVALASSLGRFDATIVVVSPPELTAAFGQLAARFDAAASGAGRGPEEEATERHEP